LDFVHFSSMALAANFIAFILSVCLLICINITKKFWKFFFHF
jgi:hypothetical protein